MNNEMWFPVTKSFILLNHPSTRTTSLNRLHNNMLLPSFSPMDKSHKSCLGWRLFHLPFVCLWWIKTLSKQCSVSRKYQKACYNSLPAYCSSSWQPYLWVWKQLSDSHRAHTWSRFGSSCHPSLPILCSVIGKQRQTEKWSLVSVSNKVHLCRGSISDWALCVKRCWSSW